MKFNILIIGTIALALFSSSCSKSNFKIKKVASPDNSIGVNITLNQDGEVHYSVLKDQVVVLESSRLGIIRKDDDFSKGLDLISVSEIEEVKDEYELLVGKQRNIKYGRHYQRR